MIKPKNKCLHFLTNTFHFIFITFYRYLIIIKIICYIKKLFYECRPRWSDTHTDHFPIENFNMED